jgi:tRNA(fMet)-specific endonuclease VapC
MESSLICLDTSILIDFFRSKDKETTAFYKLSENYDFAISIITRYEFALGFKDPENPFLKDLLSDMEILNFDIKCSVKAENIYRTLKKENLLIPALDIFIGASAIVNNMRIATMNKEHFKRIPDLVLVDF